MSSSAMTQHSETFRLSSEVFAKGSRDPLFRDLIERRLSGVDFEPMPTAPFFCDQTFHVIPGLVVVHATTSGLRINRTKSLLADGRNDISLLVNLSGRFRVSTRTRDVAIENNQAIIRDMAQINSLARSTRGTTVNLIVPRTKVASLVTNIEDKICRPIQGENPVLKLLMGYVGALQANTAPAALSQQVVATHVHDLVALLIGATGDAADHAEEGGGTAARLHAIKTDIIQRAVHPRLSLEAIAARHHITARYARMLLESDGTTFTALVLEQRLLCAHRMLTDPRLASRSVSEIAFDAGFNNLSYFNRTFRRRFGGTPSELRYAGRERRD
jgi:AraC-like DNA-binding protein